MSQKEQTLREFAEELQTKVDAYKESINGITDVDELKKIEEELIEDAKKLDEEIANREYELPSNTIFDGKEYSRADVAGKIIYLLDKQEQGWQMVLGLYELVKYWKTVTNTTNVIRHGALDSTLRTLDQCKFRGFTEWRDILVINEYMKALHEEYVRGNTLQIFIAQKHSAVVDRLELLSPRQSVEEDGTIINLNQ